MTRRHQRSEPVFDPEIEATIRRARAARRRQNRVQQDNQEGSSEMANQGGNPENNRNPCGQSDQIKKDLEALVARGMTSVTAEIINEFLAKFDDLQKKYISNSDIRKNLPIYEANLAKSQERVQTCA
ncbi:OLC1v1024551C1 [Oldenlandia corymbosa var. corymbosa]|uniref:OLC1v1024551C1 n=1 Tax=Oldenlandia corymbosa var. corymbosa TaxID=529605 RepID=A0AAV1C332_OLDCO|nr:OLC1v1024551C1 [Oldenlandia corymbosa var. corymbosa]